MVKISGNYAGGLRCSAQHGPSGTELITDAPVDNQGQGRSFSPTDLLATAMGTCMMTVMGIWAQRNNVDLSGSTFTVTKEMSTTAPRRVARLGVSFQMPAGVAAEHRERLEAAAHTCPVHQSLHPDVVCDLDFTWG